MTAGTGASAGRSVLTPEPYSPSPAGPQPATPLHAFGTFALALLIALVLILVGEAIGGIPAGLAPVISLQLGGLVAVAIVILAAELVPRQVLALYRPAVTDLAGGVLLGAGLTVALAASLAHLYTLGEAEQHAEAVEQTITRVWDATGPLVVVGLIALFAPLAEELVFRGMILRSLLGRWPAWVAVGLSSLMFAVLHGHLVHGSITLVLGLACALATLWRGNIWIAVVIHMAYNSTALFLDMVLGYTDILPLWTIVPGLAMMGAGIWLVGRGSPAATGGQG